MIAVYILGGVVAYLIVMVGLGKWLKHRRHNTY